MTKLTQLIKEKVTNVTWLEDAVDHALEGRFPLTKSIAKELGIGQKITAIHITDPQGAMRLISMQGTRKSISTMTKVPDWHLNLLEGVHKSGVVYKVEGEVLLSSHRDAMTRPDQRGRRWIKFPAAAWDDVLRFNLSSTYNAIGRKYEDFLVSSKGYPEMAWEVTSKRFTSSTAELEAKRKFLSMHFDLSLQFVNKHKDDLKQVFPGPENLKLQVVTDGSYNEIILTNIKLLSVIYDEVEINKTAGGSQMEKKIVNSVPPGKAVATVKESLEIMKWFNQPV